MTARGGFDYASLEGFPCLGCNGVTVRFQHAYGQVMFSMCRFVDDDRFAHLSEKEVERRKTAFSMCPEEFAKEYPEAVVSPAVYQPQAPTAPEKER